MDKSISQDIADLKFQLQKLIVGQENALEKTVITLIAGGNVLLEGVPGVAKTLLARSLAASINSSFSRIQFTPDLLPSDITGTVVFNLKSNEFSTVFGPVFHQIILADEINRAPPKVQSALLEAMQEHQVTIQGTTYPLPSPFFVIATENPLESEGTYPLPEAETDRFMTKIVMTLPSIDDEIVIMERFCGERVPQAEPVLSIEKILALQNSVRKIHANAKIHHYIAEIVGATRTASPVITIGASPRASIGLLMCSKAHALLNGRDYVIPEDVIHVSMEVLRHRIRLSFEAQLDGITPDTVIKDILTTVSIP
ncbi:AAA family ATPase [Methanocorpusculum parvum]|uniref:AAA family ATPase n=1 Tax=Methanocorpusculum parvum TaxID=2193 RepID=UPI00296FAF56|nr:MoxR family ATPase [Methanocorpusculum parvum]